MKKFMAVFAVLILLFCSTALAAETPPPLATPTPSLNQKNASEQSVGAINQFSETWITASDLGSTAAYVLDRDGQLYRWDYSDQAPVIMCTLPVATSEMYMNYATTYPFLPAENKAQIRETVSMIVSDGDTLYAINKPAGRIGIVDEGSVQWQFELGEGYFLNENNGEERVVHGYALVKDQLYLAVDYWEEDPDAAYNTRILRIDLKNGSTQRYESSQAHRICRYGDQLLVLCESNTGVYFMQFDPQTGAFSEMDLRPVAGTALAYDAESDTIYLSTNDSIYCSQSHADSTLIASMPAAYAGGAGIVTQDGRYVFTGDGIWAVRLSDRGQTDQLTVLLQSSDPTLKSLFAQEYPEVMLDWRVDYEMTAADVADAIRTGDTSTAVFSVNVGSSFGSLVDKGFVTPMTHPDIISSVDRMYPSIAAPLKNADGQVIAYPWDFSVSTWGINRTLWNQYFPGRALPTTWKEFFTLMQEFEMMDNPEGDLFLMNWDYDTMLEFVLSSFILRANMSGEAVDFTDPVLIETLTELNKARQLLMSRGIETYDEAEIFWDSEVVGDHSIFHYGQGASTRSAYLWSTDALTPFVFADGDTPVYPGSMRVLVINPNAPNKEAAEAFVATLTSMEYGVMRDYVLHADATKPYNQKPYTVTGDMIELWQDAASSIWISTNDPLQSDAFTAQARTLIERYAAGQLNDHMFLIKLNETASMVESEVQ